MFVINFAVGWQYLGRIRTMAVEKVEKNDFSKFIRATLYLDSKQGWRTTEIGVKNRMDKTHVLVKTLCLINDFSM